MKKILLALLLALAQANAFSAAPGEGRAAPDFTASRLDGQPGKPFALKDLRGKVVYLDFWASWCPPCRASFPVLDKMYSERKGQGLEVIGVNKDQEPAEAAKFLAEYPVSFPLLADRKDTLVTLFHVKAMPSAYIIDRKGTIRFAHLGFNRDTEAQIEAEVAQLLEEKP
ncbi:MAG: TlpA family protein disulfide reductase [Sulfuricellaceae bacterium]|nr:TlpA family protein disulfide reductase [Sulfuricellaceae bacterium]